MHSDLPALAVVAEDPAELVAEDLLSNATNRKHLFEVARVGTVHHHENTAKKQKSWNKKRPPVILGIAVAVAAVIGGFAATKLDRSTDSEAWPPTESAVFQNARGFNLVVPPSVLSVEPGLSSELELNVVSASRFVRITFLLPKCDNQSIQLVDTPDSVDGIVWWDNSTNTELAPSSTTLKKVTPTDVFSPTNALYVAIAQGAVWIPFTFCRRPATVVVRRLGAIPEHDLIATHYDRLVDHSFDASKDTTVFSIPFRLSVKTDVDRRTTDDTVDVRIFVDHGSVGIAPGDLHDGVDVGDHDATAGDETSLEHSVELNNILLTELSSRWTEVRYTATRTHMNVTVFFSLVAYRPSDGGHRRATMELSSKFLTRIILPKTEVEECIEAKNVALKEAKQAQGQAEKASGEFNACDEKRKDCKKKAPEQVRKCEADCRREKAVLDGEINRHLGIVAKCRETRDKDVSKCQKGREKDVYWMKIKIKQLKTCWEELSRAVVEEQLWSADLIKIANRCAYADPDLLE